MVEMLSEGIATSRGRSGALLHRDRVNGRVKGRRGARLAAITSGGAIPENANYAVIAEPDGKTVGTLDEDFAMESLVGDVFLLGTHSWRIKRVEVRTRSGHRCAWRGAFDSVLAGRGAGPLARTLGRGGADPRAHFRAMQSRYRHFSFENADWTKRERSKRPLTFEPARPNWAHCPRRRTVVAERFFDQAGGMQFVLHAPFGSRITRAWGLALRKRFCRTFNFELQAAATDNGLVLSLSDQHSFPLELVFAFLKGGNSRRRVAAGAARPLPCSARAGAGIRRERLPFCDSAGASASPAPIQRMRADDLLAAVFPDQVACAENLDRTNPRSGSSAGERNHRQLSARGDGSRWIARGSGGHRRRAHSYCGDRYRASLAVLA